MAARISCPNLACDASYSGTKNFAGRSVRCKKCGTPFIAVQDESATIDDIPVSPIDIPNPFGKYRVLRKLGQGGMGSVYLAQDDGLGRTVSLKVPYLSNRDNAEILERFRREAQAGAQLQHPSFCQVYEAGEFDGRPYLAMAYIPGKTMTSLVNRDTPMDTRQATRLVRKVALAMAEAHEKGIIHRDLKPSNIMIDPKGEPIILDFGLARRDDLDGDVTLTASGEMLGTLPYMPPEQIRGDRAAMGPASDIYSLGVILYELLAGRRPFEGSKPALIFAITQSEPALASSHRPGLEAGLDAVCAKAMSKATEDRFGSMRDLAGELRPGRYRMSGAVVDLRTAMTVRQIMTPQIRYYRSLLSLSWFCFVAIFFGGGISVAAFSKQSIQNKINGIFLFLIGIGLLIASYGFARLASHCLNKIRCPRCNGNWIMLLKYNFSVPSGLKCCPYCELSLDGRMPRSYKS